MAKQKEATIQDIYEVLAGNALKGKDGLVREMRDVKKTLAEAQVEREKMSATLLSVQAKLDALEKRPTFGKFLRAAVSLLVTTKPPIPPAL